MTAGPFVHQGFGATRPTASEAGCVRFDVLQDTSNPDRYYFYEVYQDEAAFQAHTQTPHPTRWRAAAGECLAGPSSAIRTATIFPRDYG